MRKILVCQLLTGLLFASLLPLSAPADTPTSDGPELLRIEKEACDAYLRGDADYLDKLLTEDFTAINGRAEINNKTEELKEVRAGEIHYTVFENKDMQVHQHGDMAAVIGVTTVKGTSPDGKTFAVEVRFTDVFAKVSGRWRMVAGHSSRLPPKEG